METSGNSKAVYEDALFSILMQNAMDAEGSALHIHNKTYSQDQVHAVSPEADARCHAAIERGFEEQQRQKKRHSRKHLWGFALSAVIVLLSVYAVVSVVKYETLVNPFEARRWAESSLYSFRYIPEGYVLDEEGADFDTEWFLYHNEDANIMLRVTHGASHIEFNIDTEDAYEVSNIEYGRFVGILVCKGNRVHLAVADPAQDTLVQIITYQLKKQEVLTMLENVHYIGP